MTHLFLLTLGPVQSFISQARKTQDLYAGSQILSELLFTAISAFENEFNSPIAGKVIFPTISQESSRISLPNRFIGKINSDQWDKTKLVDKARKIENKIREEFQEIANTALDKAEITQIPLGCSEQIKSHLEIFWVFKEIEKTGFATAYKELEILGGAIKNVRSFTQYEYAGIAGESGRKCSLDGINNVLFYRPNLTPQGKENTPAFIVKDAKQLDRFTLNPGEGLSAISLVKRFYPNTAGFPSTAEVALMYDEKQVSEKEKILSCYKKLFNQDEIGQACVQLFNNGWVEKINLKNLDSFNDTFDYQMLYEENIHSKTLPNTTQLALVKELYQKLKNTLKTKYYAIVLFDGDKMGKWLSGEYIKDINQLEEFHEEMSKRLSDFGNQARNILNKSQKNGETIYTGGDDFMGFINLHYLFKVMNDLRKQFYEKINEHEKIGELKKIDHYLTFSAGIVIAHYKTPFSEVLKKVREVEKKAKKEGGRNAFAISVLKHSGEMQETVFKWDIDPESPNGCSIWDNLAHIALELDSEKGHFSNTFIQNLTSEFYQLTGAELHEIDDKNRNISALKGALEYEIKRLVHRSLDKEENPKEDNRRKENLVKAVQALWRNAPEPQTRNFIHALHIVDFITRKTSES